MWERADLWARLGLMFAVAARFFQGLAKACEARATRALNEE